MTSKLGILSLLAGFFMGVFSGISKFMEARNFWVDLTVSKMIGENNSDAVMGLTDVEGLKSLFNLLLYDLPFFVVLLLLGAVLLIISLFLKNH